MGDRRLACALLPLFAVACISNNNPPPGSEDSGYELPEAGLPDAPASLPDATVPNGGLPEASPSPDSAPAPDAAPAPVTITAVGTDGSVEQGVPIFFSDPTGALLSSAITDANGQVTQLVPAGSQVTAVFGQSTNPVLLTIVGVEPGDALTAIDTTTAGSPSVEIQVTNLPPSPPDAGEAGADFTVSAGNCNTASATPPWELYMYPACSAGGQFPLLAIAEDDDGNLLGYAFQKNNALIPDSGLPDGDVVPVAMTSGGWAAPSTTTITATNVVHPGFNLNLNVFSLGEVAGGVVSPASKLSTANDGGTYDYVVSTHPGFADFVQTEANISGYPPSTLGDNNGLTYGAIATRGAPDAGGATLDLSTLLPFVTDAVVSYENPSQPTVSWTSESSFASTDGAVVIVSWYQNGPGQWTFVVPPATTAVKAPVLPTSVAAWAPTGTSYDIPLVMFMERDVLGGLRGPARGLGGARRRAQRRLQRLHREQQRMHRAAPRGRNAPHDRVHRRRGLNRSCALIAESSPFRSWCSSRASRRPPRVRLEQRSNRAHHRRRGLGRRRSIRLRRGRGGRRSGLDDRQRDDRQRNLDPLRWSGGQELRRARTAAHRRIRAMQPCRGRSRSRSRPRVDRRAACSSSSRARRET